jgi:DNA-binding Lrp family transcriptional regulator
MMAAMVSAIILLNVEREAINGVAERLAGLDGVAEVYSVAGRFDLAVIVRARDNDALAELVTGRMLQEKGIVHSETLIAFRAYSRSDIERTFSLGMDEPQAGGG